MPSPEFSFSLTSLRLATATRRSAATCRRLASAGAFPRSPPSTPRPPARRSETSRRFRATVRRSSAIAPYFGSNRSAGRRPPSPGFWSIARAKRSIARTKRRAASVLSWDVSTPTALSPRCVRSRIAWVDASSRSSFLSVAGSSYTSTWASPGPRSTCSPMRRADAAVAARSATTLDSLSARAVRFRFSDRAPMVAATSDPWLMIRPRSADSRAASTAPGLTGGWLAAPTVISTSRSPSRPWVSMRATESWRIRSAYCEATRSSTRTFPPGSAGSRTPATRPICTPARRTAAPSTSPPTSVKSA